MAALMGDRNYYIDAVYYYMRRCVCSHTNCRHHHYLPLDSLSSPDPFAGAEGNLKQIYEKNSKKLQTFIVEKEGRTSEDGMR